MTDLDNVLFPAIEPYNFGHLKVSEIHTLYYEECGNPNGKPVVFLHGGPGGGIQEYHRRFFDPDKYRIVLFDQRGCGKSTPHASLEENTTWDLVEDIEKLRQHCKIEKWQVFGGSWGSTLALAYAETHPQSVTELVLRGIFLLRDEEIRWFYQYGAHQIFPDAWEEYCRPIPEAERQDFVKAFYNRLTSSDHETQLQAAKAWSLWEGLTTKLVPDLDYASTFSADLFAVAFARIECHYFINKGFLAEDGYLLHHADKIRHIPTIIIHGRYDACCTVKNAWDLHKVLPDAQLVIVPVAGHAASEVEIAKELVRATNSFL